MSVPCGFANIFAAFASGAAAVVLSLLPRPWRGHSVEGVVPVQSALVLWGDLGKKTLVLFTENLD